MFSILLQNIQKVRGYTALESTYGNLNGDDSGQ